MASAKPTKVPRFAALLAWQASTWYQVGERVTNDSGKIYQCTTAGTTAGAGGPTGTNASITDGTAKWMYLAPTAPAWSSGTTYVAGDRVTNGGNLYLCLQAGAGTSTSSPGGTGRSTLYGDGYVWAYLASATAVTAEPAEGQKDVGYTPGTNPTAQVMNWLFRLHEQWIRFLSDLTAADGAKRLQHVADLTALEALTPGDGDFADVGSNGLYRFVLADATTVDSPWVVADGGATGKWIHVLYALVGATTAPVANGLARLDANKVLAVTAAAASGATALKGTGDGAGPGVSGTGGATAPGVKGTAATASGKNGVEGTGDGVGAGVKGTGGNTSGPGGSFSGGTGGDGVDGLAGDTGVGVYGQGGATSGIGVRGVAQGGNTDGVKGEGHGSGPGVEGVGGASGPGVKGTGGATGTAGVIGVAGGTSGGAGVQGTGDGGGPGVSGTGGSGGNGVEGTGVGGGSGMKGTGGVTNGVGVEGHGTGTGIGVTGQSAAGPGMSCIISGDAKRGAFLLGSHNGALTAGGTPVVGEMFYDTSTDKVMVYTSIGWKSLTPA